MRHQPVSAISHITHISVYLMLFAHLRVLYVVLHAQTASQWILNNAGDKIAAEGVALVLQHHARLNETDSVQRLRLLYLFHDLLHHRFVTPCISKNFHLDMHTLLKRAVKVIDMHTRLSKRVTEQCYH